MKTGEREDRSCSSSGKFFKHEFKDHYSLSFFESVRENEEKNAFPGTGPV